DFGDGECHTLQSIIHSKEFSAPHMAHMGLFNIEGVDVGMRVEHPTGSFARLQEMSRGKDTTTGHWEIAGIVSKQAMPVFPDGFPPECIEKLEKAFGRKVLCNKPYSGTQVIHDYGREHIETGALIVYTSADSVLQIAAHNSVLSEPELYEVCQKAREIMQGPWAVGRVIARPFVGTWPDYTRTSGRHDYSLVPPADTMMDVLARAGLATIGVGKIRDIFAGKGIGRHIPMDGNEDGMEKTISTLDEDFTGLCFTNLVDFDMKYGHRRDVDGYARATTVFDKQLGTFLERMKEDDVLMITADHGCDPGAPGSDHTREYVPLLVYGAGVRKGVDLGTRPTFADIAATAVEMFGEKLDTPGTSFWQKIKG
ncbi:MAG: phosphopentomutase, partial [Schwartzia sp.]|nr:phosphopentomutase [Schwartzia sp. (in: firmicutes)]